MLARDALIHRLRAEGQTLRAIAAATGLSHSSVHVALHRDPARELLRRGSPLADRQLCKRGLHPVTPENTLNWPSGPRCRECRRVSDRTRYQRRKVSRGVKNGDHRRRAREYGVDYEPVKPGVVFERDRWLCGICGKRIDSRLRFPDLWSVSLDHIVPMALGGGHTYANTQASHFICNSIKSATGAGDQLALFG